MTKRLLCILALGSALSALPSLAEAETLNNAVMNALRQHPTLEAARSVEERIQEERAEQKSGLFPEFSTSLSGGRIFADNSTTRGLVTTRGEAYSYLWEGSASLTQPLFDGMEVYNRIDAADARAQAQNYTVTDVRQNLALRAAQSYLNVMRTREAMENIANYRETLKAYLDRIELMVNEGAADESEAAQARNISLLLQDSLLEFEGQEAAAEADYIELMGSMPESELELPLITEGVRFANVDEAVEYTQQHHPLILASRKELEASAFDIEAEEGTLFPDIDGEVSYTKRDQREEIGGELLDQRALLRMSWDFSTGGGDFARVRQTKARYSEALANMQARHREIVKEVRRAFALYQAASKQDELIKQREEITSGLFETYKAQFEGARVSLLQLMQTENQMFNTKLEAINTKYEHLNSYYMLMASMGDLLKILNVDYEPQEEFVYPKIQEAAVIEQAPEVVYPEEETAQQTVEPQIYEPIAPIEIEVQEAAIPTESVEPTIWGTSTEVMTPQPIGVPKEQIYPLEDYQ